MHELEILKTNLNRYNGELRPLYDPGVANDLQERDESLAWRFSEVFPTFESK